VPLGSDLRLLRAVVFTAVCLVLSAVGHVMMSGVGIPAWALLVGFAGVFVVALGLTGRECSYPGIAGTVLASELALHFFFSAAQGTAQAAPSAAGAAALWVAALVCVPGQHGAALPPGMSVGALLRSVGLNPALAAHAPAGTASMSMSMGTMSMASMPMGSHSMAGMAGMAGMSASMPMGAGTGAGMSGMGHGMWAMVAAHVIAGLLSACWLRRGEAAAFSLLRTMGTVAVRCLLRLTLLVLGFLRGVWTPPAPGRRTDGAWLLPQAGRCALLHVVIRRGPPLCPAVA
jgi:hypothetical protein